MKKLIIYTMGLLVALSLSSCTLDLFPNNAISTRESMKSVNDVLSFRNGIYSSMKQVLNGKYVYTPDLQTDLYHAPLKFGNFEGDFYHYSVLSTNSTVEEIWYDIYSVIANVNWTIEGAQSLLEKENISAKDKAEIKEYYGEACFFRALLYFNLTRYFCDAYTPAKATETMGVPVVTKYAPTTDKSKYPARNTLQEVYTQILSDIAEAQKYVISYESMKEQNANDLVKYINKDAVTALHARVALYMQDYKTAAEKASQIIDSQHYTLTNDAETFAHGWENDNLTETIWQVEMTGSDDTHAHIESPQGIGNSFEYFIYNNSGEPGDDNPQYLPEDWALNLYDKNDIRYYAYFDKRHITKPVEGDLTLMVKYPGNPSLYEGRSNYLNKPKVFRLAEMYLICAEANAEIGNASKASKYLNELRAIRIKGYSGQDFSGDKLTQEIRDERVRELFGEGFRLDDLKRWHIGFKRSAGQIPDLMMPGTNYARCERKADDPKFVWPIPLAEIECNPQMKQNPSY